MLHRNAVSTAVDKALDVALYSLLTVGAVVVFATIIVMLLNQP